MADAKATNDKWADEVKARRDAEAELLALRARLRALVAQWTFWAESDERFSDDAAHKFRGESIRQCIAEIEAALLAAGAPPHAETR